MKKNSLYVYVESFGTITPVPLDSEGNPDWRRYSDSGGTLQVLQDAYDRDKDNIQIIPDPLITFSPREIDARRLRLALHQLDLLVTVEQAIATLGKAAQIDWEYATQIKEDYPLVLALATNLGLDTEAIFTLAISLD